MIHTELLMSDQYWIKTQMAEISAYRSDGSILQQVPFPLASPQLFWLWSIFSQLTGMLNQFP